MIYFLRAERSVGSIEEGWIKIGTTIRLSVRLKQIAAEIGQTPTVLGVLDGSHSEERALHARLAMVRVLGEWFVPCAALTEIVASETRPWDGMDEVPLPRFGVIRIDEYAIERAKIAAALMGMTLYDYTNRIVLEAAEEDIVREATKLAEAMEARRTA